MNLRKSGPWVGAAGMLIALWFYGFIVLVAPWWMLPVMGVLWVALLVVLVRSFDRRPLVAFAVPFVAMALWFAIVVAGGAWWGWSA